MQFKTLLALCALTTTVLADGAAIVAAINDISEKTVGLNESVASWAGPSNPLGTVPILLDSTELLAALLSGTKTAQKSQNLTLEETINIVGPTQTLVTDTQSTLTTLIAAEPKFKTLLLKPLIYVTLEAQKSAADKFSKAVLEKVPVALQGIAATIVAPIDTAFDKAIAAYK